MYYDIEGLCPTNNGMGDHGFCIQLYPKWRDLVEKSGLDQEKIDSLLNNWGRRWLDACGFDQMFDPDRSGIEYPPKAIGKNAYHLYKPLRDLRVMWGEWGPEHIVVPGDACGLDIDHDMGTESMILLPHNIDTWRQKNLILIVFTYISNIMSLRNE